MTQPPGPHHGRHYTRRLQVDVRTWTGRLDPALTAWLGDNLITVNGQQLTVHNADHTPVTLHPGWVLIRHDDGALLVKSPAAATRELEPETP